MDVQLVSSLSVAVTAFIGLIGFITYSLRKKNENIFSTKVKYYSEYIKLISDDPTTKEETEDWNNKYEVICNNIFLFSPTKVVKAVSSDYDQKKYEKSVTEMRKDLTAEIHSKRSLKTALIFLNKLWGISENIKNDDVQFFIINTNKNNNSSNEAEMLKDHKASAYYSPWKERIGYIKENDIIFLYSSGLGFIAYGYADGIVHKELDKSEFNEEWYQKLNDFRILNRIISAREMKERIGENLMLRASFCRLRSSTGRKIYNEVSKNHITKT